MWEDGHVPLDVSGTESSETETSHTIMILINSMAAMNTTAAPISSQQIGEKLIAVTNNMTVPEKPFPLLGKFCLAWFRIVVTLRKIIDKFQQAEQTSQELTMVI